MQRGNTAREGNLGRGLRRTSGARQGTNERFGTSSSARMDDTSKSEEGKKGNAPGWIQQGGEVDDRGRRRGLGKERLLTQ